MKIVCEKDKILKALNSVTKAVASKTTMPILEGILIQTNDKEVKLTTYDLEIGIEYIIDADVKEQGATVVNAIMFSEIIRKLPDTEIHISLNEQNLLVIECEGSLYKLATMNPEEFPELPQITVENSIEIEQNALKEMIRKTIFAVSTEENRPIFTGCLFEIKNNKLNVVAVDGFRLAWKSKFLQNSSNDFTAMLSAEEEAAIEARDEFASLIDSKNYLDGDSETIERRIDYLNLEIAALEEKIRISNEEIKNIDSAEFLELTTRLAETEETANQLIKELAEYKIIIETEIEDKTPKRRAILAAAYDRKQKELENVQKIVDNYKEDQKILIHKAYVIETERIKGFQEEIALHKNEITEMNILLADVSKAKDVLAIENDKQKLKELDTVVKNIKHRQKYSQTPSEIFEEIAAYLGGMDTRSFVEEPVMPSVEPLDLELPMNEEIHSFAQSSAESPSILDTEEVVSELPKEMDLEETVNSDPEPLNDNSFVIYKRVNAKYD